jgi:predicted ATPase/DNA-binding winged helix-turn-helix (wHTH) protein
LATTQRSARCAVNGDAMTAGDDSRAREIASFGPFRLLTAERLLLKEHEPVALGGRALDILIALVERPGEVVSRRDLIKRVWPDVTVEETNLRVHVAGLRKALGDGQDGARYITNVPRRGYCFVAPVLRSAAAQPAVATAAPASRPQRLPTLLARMVGREETVAALCSLLASRRFVSIVGAGGMGKTTVAVAVAHALLDDFAGAVCFVDLGAVTDAALVAGAVGAALGGFVQAQDPVASLLAFLAEKRLLLVLDNCEHVIEAVAALTERLFVELPHLHLLTTSREALRVEGETVHLLLPLDSPHEDSGLTADQALASPAVQLFMERAAASGYESELSDADAPTVAGICRRLDGLALAIELAASRVGAYGIRGTADLLDKRFKLLWQGRRSALPRHQTLQALLDWSYNLLSEHEKTTLCRLSVFVGSFTLEGALAVVGDIGADAAKVAEAAASLVSKSLLWTLDTGGSSYFRLPDTTRAYAAAKLADSEADDAVARRHALHYAGLFDSDKLRASAFGGRDMSAYAPHMGNVRAALEWSFSGAGDAAVGVELAARAAPLFLGFSLLSECERWCERGMTALQEADRGTKRELALQEALAISAMFTRGNGDEVKAAIERGLGLAEALEDRQHQLHLLAGLHIFLTRIGDFRAALAVAERSVAVAGEVGDPAGIVMAEWMIGVAHHLVGDQAAAQRHCERGLEQAAARGDVHVDFFGYDHRVRALVALARALWLRGLPERALEVAHQVTDEAASRDHPVTVCISYIYTITVFLWTGDFEEVGARIERLLAHAAKYALWPYHAVGLALKGELLVARGEPGAGVQLLRSALATLQTERQQILATGFFRALAEGLAQCGQLGEATAVIAGAVELARRRGTTFDLPDLLRAQAEIFLAGPQPDVAAAEESLVNSLECARRQSALGWELRAAIQLARLWAERGRAQDARNRLSGLYRRFTEGFETADLKAARRLLDELGHLSQGGEPHSLRT